MPPLKMTWSVAKGLFSKPVTRAYPVETRAFYPNTRGHIGIQADKCILCVLCDKKCPTNAIKVGRNEKFWAIDRLKCIQCGYCIEVCPKKCLTMEPRYATPSTTKEVFTVAIPFTPPAPKPAVPAAASAPPAEPKAQG